MLDPTTRRRFLIAAIAFSGLFTEFGPSVLRINKAFAQPRDGLNSSTRAAMVRMARMLYPYDAISDEIYGEVLDQTLTAVPKNQAFAELLKNAEAALNAQQQTAWIDLDEDAQITAMKAVEHMDFFTAIQEAVRLHLYSHPMLWQHLGYEGSSFDQGGYLYRGAGVIDWLLESR